MKRRAPLKRRALLALLVLLALLAALAVPLAWLLTTEAGLVWAFQQVAARLPGATQVATLDGRLIGPMHVRALQWRTATTDIRVTDATLDWSPWALFAGQLRITELKAHGVRVGWMASTGAAPAAAASRGPARPPEIRLPLAVHLAHLAIDDLTLAAPGASPVSVTRIELDAHTRLATAVIDRLMLRSAALDLDLVGQITPQASYPMDIATRWTARVPGSPPWSGGGRMHGDLRRLQASQRLTAPLQADLVADVDTPLDALRWNAVLTLAELPLDRLRPDLPAVTLKGELRGHGDRRQLAADGTLAALDHPDSDVTLAVRADWSQAPQPPRFDVEAQWRNIAQLPLTGLTLASARGALHTHGTLDAYALRIDADLAHPRAGPLHLSGDAHGGRTALTVQQLRLQALGGALQARGALDWQRALSWRVNFDGQDLDPGRLWAQWPGRVAVRGASNGRLGPPLTATLTIGDAHGTLRDQPFRLLADAGIAGRDYTLDRFSLQVGGAQLSAAGRVTDRWEARWDINAPDLAQVVPGASGALATQGQVRGARAAPAIAATLTGKGLRLRDYRADALDTKVDVDLADALDSQLTFTAAGIGSAATLLRAVDIEAQGRAAAHTVRVVLTDADSELRLSADGQYRDQHWQGTLRQAELASADLGRWTLDGTSEIHLGRAAASLTSTCWHRETARLCAAGAWQSAAGWSAQLSTTQLPTAVFAPWLTSGATLRGTLDATAELQAPAAGALRGDVTIRTSPGSISMLGPAEVPTGLDYGSGVVTAHIGGGRFDATLQLPLVDGGGIDLRLAAPLRADAANGDEPLHGHLRATFRRLAALALFVPQLESPRGELSADLELAGTVAQPRLSGEARLDHGALDIGRAGLHLSDARLSARSTDGGVIDLTGQVSSGGGVLRLAGRGTLRPDGWRGRLQLEGERFELANTSELALRVSPDLTLDAQPGRLDLRGDLTVPEGRFAAKDLSQAVSTSPDTVIVGEQAAPERWRTHTRVRITLGDAVRIDAYNFRGRVSGTVVAVDAPQQTTTGTGELRFDAATYTVYGTRLDIDTGRLLFSGGPIADPGLDVRASRQVSNVTAGVQVAGTLRHPELTLFSQPSMNQADILSYLLLGKPTSQAGSTEGKMLSQAAGSLGLTGGELLAQRIGQAFGIEEVGIVSGSGTEGPSLMLGTYLSPRMYVSYGIGLFSPVNTLRLRYDLSKRWQIQTQTGTATSADVLYTIER